MNEEKSKRSKILVKRALQLKYALVVLLAMLATVVTVGADFYIRLHSFIKEFLKDLPEHSIDQLMMNMNQLMYAKIIVLLIIAVAISLYVSHKFAGPIVRIEKSIEQISRGDLTEKVYFRSGDELKHLAHYFNYMTGRLKTEVKKDRDAVKDALDRLEELKGRVVDTDAREEIDKIQENLREVTEYWKIDT